MFEKEAHLLSSSPEFDHLEVNPSSTFIVIDWDDTLLPTSWLTRHQLTLDTPLISSNDLEKLETLDSAASALIRQASFLYGHVLIITNAQQGWVELSSKKFLPETHELIFSGDEDSTSFSSCPPHVGEKRKCENQSQCSEFDASGKISVVSARTMFEKEFPNEPSMWKKKAFEKILRAKIPVGFLNCAPNSMMRQKSFSDSEIEIGGLNRPDEGLNPSKKLKRRNSDLSSLDLSCLVEEDGGYEVETDFDDSGSIFSIDFEITSGKNRESADGEDPEWSNSSSDEEEKAELVSVVKKKLECVNLISIGDCFHDCDSLRKLDLGISHCLKKTVKLVEFPSVESLTSELNSLQLYLSKIVNLRNNSHLVVDRASLR